MSRAHISHVDELHIENNRSKLNWLRAAVLGANDGIVSISGLVIGVASATQNHSVIMASAVAGILAGSLSMAAGEYISVSTQRDSEQSLLAKEKMELHHYPEEELQELIGLYEKKGLSHNTAKLVAHELTEHDAFAAHVDVELGIDPHNLTNPWQAALASALAFVCGSSIPTAAILVPPAKYRIGITFAAVVVSLMLTGYLSADAIKSSRRKAMKRVVIGGMTAMAATYLIGKLFGVTIN